MSAGADPVGADAARHALWQPVHGDHAAPRDDSGKRGPVGTEKRLPDTRMHPIGADKRIASRLGPVGEAQPYAPAVLAQGAALCTQVDGVGLFAPYRSRQHAEEIGPIHGEVGIPVALDRDRAEIEQLPGLAAAPEPDFLAGRLAGERLELLADAQLMEHARAVRSELQPGTHFLQLRRLLVDVDVAAAAQQRERRREPADAAAGNQDMRLHLRATGEDGAAPYRFTASAPALQTTSSCEPVAPEQPMAPISLPPSRMGMPPRDAMTSSRVRR